MTTSLHSPAPAGHSARPRHRTASRRRIALAGLACASTVPYLTLKAAWLLGSDIGLVDRAAADTPVMEAANAATALMEVVALVLAVAFVHPAGRRIPAPLVQVPMYVGTGLLGGILVQLPLDAVLTLVAPRPTASAAQTGPIEPWVYTVVYSGFAVLGVCLLALYAAYVRDRWARPLGWSRPLGEWSPAPSLRGRPLALSIALAAAGVANPVALAAARGGVGAHVLMMAIAGVCAAVGIVALATRRPRGMPGTLAVGLAWFGSAASAAWGTYTALILAVPNPLKGDTPVPPAFLGACVVLALAGWSALPLLRRLTSAATPTL